MTDVQKRISELTDRIHYLNHRYYQDSVSEISDPEFDALLRELQDLEKQHPALTKKEVSIILINCLIKF